MSRAKAVAERAALDFYATPDALAKAIVTRVAEQEGVPDLVIEPSAGEGPFVRAALYEWLGQAISITAIDLDPSHVDGLFRAGADTVIEADWVKYAPMIELPAAFAAVPSQGLPRRGCVFILGNPPYREAESHIRAALALLTPGDVLAFLLRINFLGSRNRLAFWEEFPATWMAPIVPRPSFTRGGTDGTEYAVFAWKKRGVCEGPPPLTRIAPPIRWTP